ncbi:tetratricopeptide repeat protein, partial [Dolichospermum planctonicum]|uniref:tetratricopeptide repeat protein n=1 Tax=Dolichospermum planctonicum TaxID=136072 RepID=UPI00396A917A
MSQGHVANDLFYKIAYEKYLQIHPHPTNVPYQKYRNSHITVYGLQIKRKPTLVEFIDHVLDFITLEVDMKIRFVVPISLLILVSGWFIGAKSWESSTSATDIEKSLCSKTFPDDKNCPVIVLDPKTSYGFSEIKQLIPAIVNDVVSEKTGGSTYQESGESTTSSTVEQTEEDIKKQVLEKLESLTGSTALQYEDLDPGNEPTDLAIQKQWMTAIYNYQIKRNVTYQKIIADANNGSEDNKCNLPFGICLWPLEQNNDTSNGVNEKDSELYKKLKNDILYYMKSQQPQTTTTNNNQKEVNKNELKDKQKAIDDYTQAININPNDADAYNNRGLVRSELGNKQGAIDDYTQAIKINPNYSYAYNNRGIVRSELGNKPGAIDDYTQAIKINPNNAEAYNNRGLVRSELG